MEKRGPEASILSFYFIVGIASLRKMQLLVPVQVVRVLGIAEVRCCSFMECRGKVLARSTQQTGPAGGNEKVLQHFYSKAM